MSDSEDVRFKTNVLLKSIIGKDLINNDNIAVLELVKNSYDAGTPRVIVAFKNLKLNDDNSNSAYSARSSKIIIQDFGHGMDREDLVGKWLNIAYSEKKLNKYANNRYLAGAKGVGRFSCDRLGKFLDLYTRKLNGRIYHLRINWNNFEVENDQNLTIQDIPLSISVIPDEQFKRITGFDLFEKGTIVEISKLRSAWVYLLDNQKNQKWDTTKIFKLKDYLAKLINPNQAYGISSFRIFLEVPDFIEEEKDKEEFKKLNGEINNKILKELFFKATSVEGRISEDGKEITTILKDKGRTIFEIVEYNNTFPMLKNIKVFLLFLNPYAKAYFTKQTGTRSVNFGSIFLFVNSFRVSPLGDEGNDWLGLELRKGQGYARFLGTRDLIGRIEITDPDNDFKIISSREGIVRDDRFDQLVTPTPPYDGFFYKILKRLEKYVVDGLMWDRTPEGSNVINELEKKLKDKAWQYDPKDEVFEHSTSKKNAKILESISSIMAVKAEEVKHIYINEELIGQMLEESEEMAFEKVREVVKQLSKLDPKSVDEATKAMLDHLDQVIAEKDELIRQKKAEVERSREEKNILQEKLLKAEKEVAEVKVEADRLKFENKSKETQIAYFKTSQTLDLDRVINLHHHIKILSHTIDNSVAELSFSIEEGSFTIEDLKEELSRISFANQKVLTITKFATKANFLLESQKINVDIIRFIIQYIKEVYQELVGLKMVIDFDIKEGLQYIMKFTPIEVSMVVDNLLDNSLKANASKVCFKFNNVGDKLVIQYQDNGLGFDESIPEGSENVIFEKGFTTTYGSGLGLHHVSQILTDMNGTIQVKRLESGVEFNIVVESQ